jgi:hypothetical protein
LQDVCLQVDFRAPSGRTTRIDAFWDGNQTWRVRFMPDEVGRWHWESRSNRDDSGLKDQRGDFDCCPDNGTTSFEQHGPLTLSPNRHYLMHADGTPYFWLADTAWNGPLLSSENDWQEYLHTRKTQNFTAVQWIPTQWIAAPEGDALKQKAFDGCESISINPTFFQRLDQRMDACNRAGMLSVPVLLWAAAWGYTKIMAVNPGVSLPEGQAILLARYMVARWSANFIVWILAGDGSYRGDGAARWQRIGRSVFGNRDHAPVALHPGGAQWNMHEFRREEWLDIAGYQSGHSAGQFTLRWLLSGPPAKDWRVVPHRPFINLEPSYENHNEYGSHRPIQAYPVRRALYWSLLIAPTAGVTYGGHGVWGWDDGTQPPTAHPNSGTPLHWRAALQMPAAQQVFHLFTFFTSLPWWRLRPDPGVLAVRPGKLIPSRTITASSTSDGHLLVIYVPGNTGVYLKRSSLSNGFSAQWFNPRCGEYLEAGFQIKKSRVYFRTPGAKDWLLVVQKRILLD